MKEDCFAFDIKKVIGDDDRPRCNILTKMVCKNRECSFYKTQAQYEKDIKKYRDLLIIS